MAGLYIINPRIRYDYSLSYTDVDDYSEAGYIEITKPDGTVTERTGLLGGAVNTGDKLRIVTKPGWIVDNSPKLNQYQVSGGTRTFLGQIESVDRGDWGTVFLHKFANRLEVDEIQFRQLPPEITTEEETVTETIPRPEPEYIENDNMRLGEERILNKGSEGEALVTYRVTYTNGVETKREEINREILSEATPDVVEIGTYDGPVETVIIHPEKPTRKGNVIYIPYDDRVIYKDATTGEILYEDIELTGGLIVEVEPAPNPPVHLEYQLRGEIRWEFQSELRATGTVPISRGNQIAIPEVEGLTFYNLSTGEKVSGTFEFEDVVIITHDGEFIEHFVFEPKTPIYIEAPEEHERHIVIPFIEGVLFFDDLTGEVYVAGERLIGGKLTVRARAVDEKNHYIFNQNTSWTYIRPGGIKAPAPDVFDNFADIPYVTTAEYYDADTGEVFKPGQTVLSSGSEYDRRTIRVRAKEGFFLTNPYAEWTFGFGYRGLRVSMVMSPLEKYDGRLDPDYEPERLGWRKIEYTNDVFNYIDVTVNGKQLTEWGKNSIPVGQTEIIVKLKEQPANNWDIDWMRDREGNPQRHNLLISPSKYQNNGYLEHIGNDVLRWKGNLPDDVSLVRVIPLVRQVQTKKEVDYVNTTLYQTARFNFRGPITGDITGTREPILKEDMGKYVKLYVDDKEVTKDDLETVFGAETDFAYAKHNKFPIKKGYRKIRLSFSGTEYGLDFRWTGVSDFYKDSSTPSIVMYISGAGTHYFETDANGDAVWEGIIPENTNHIQLNALIGTTEPAEPMEVDIEPPWYNSEKRMIWIKEDSDFFIEYADYEFPDKVYEVGKHTLTRDTRIYARHKRNFMKINGRYRLFSIKNFLGGRTIWNFWYFEDNEFKITAQKPTQSGFYVTIPDDPNIYYYDLYSREVVSGTIDLRTRRDGRMLIQPYPGWWNYELTNKGIRWTFTESDYVYAEAPTQKDNTITIPNVFGVEYFNKITNNVLTGKVRIIREITIGARATDDYILGSEVNEWTFKPVEGSIREVIAKAPFISGNWITIPNINGITYYDVDTGQTLEGALYAARNIKIGVKPKDPDVNILNPDDKWDFEHTPTERDYQKELYIKDRSEGLTIRVNGVEIAGSVFVVDIREDVTIEIVAQGGVVLNDTPYITDTTGKRYPFQLEGKNKASKVFDFTSTEPLEITIGKVTNKHQSLLFMGENTTLEARNKDTGDITYVSPGQTINLDRKNTYEFIITPDEGHIFDRDGSIKYSGNTYTIKPTSDTKASYMIIQLVVNVVINMSAYKIQETIPTDTIGFNNLYLVDKETLSEISREFLIRKRQFMVSPGGAGGLNYDSQLITDPHTYIINTIQLPFKVEDKDIANRGRVTLGFTTLRPTAPRLKTDKLSLDLGTIRVEPKYNNAYDYKNTSIMLHLPYTNTVMVEPNYAVGETISIEYLVDAYTGHTTINLRSSLVNGNVFHTVETYIGNEIPFISMKDGSTVGSTGETRSLINNNTPRPFIEVIRNVPHQMDSIFNRDVTETVDQLGSVRGRVYVHNISLDLDATTAEVSTIKSILSGGITIK